MMGKLELKKIVLKEFIDANCFAKENGKLEFMSDWDPHSMSQF